MREVIFNSKIQKANGKRLIVIPCTSPFDRFEYTNQSIKDTVDIFFTHKIQLKNYKSLSIPA